MGEAEKNTCPASPGGSLRWEKGQDISSLEKGSCLVWKGTGDFTSTLRGKDNPPQQTKMELSLQPEALYREGKVLRTCTGPALTVRFADRTWRFYEQERAVSTCLRGTEP